LGHRFPWEDPTDTPVGEDPAVEIGRPPPPTKVPDPLGFPFDFGEWWQVAKWAYVATGAASTALGMYAGSQGWAPHANYLFLLQLGFMSGAVYLDKTAESRAASVGDARASRRALPLEASDVGGHWEAVSVGHVLDVASDAAAMASAVDRYVRCLTGADCADAGWERQMALAHVDRLRASLILASIACDRAAIGLPKDLRDARIRREHVTNVVREIVAARRLPDAERALLGRAPLATEGQIVAELRACYTERALPETVTGGTALVLAAGSMRHLARHVHIFLPNGM